jgi:flagellar basal-body rod protein FlgC
MSISSISNIAAQGMMAQTKRLAASANNVANIDSVNYRRQSVELTPLDTGGVSATVTEAATPSADGIDPAAEVVDQIGAARSFELNAAAFEAGADLWDVLATMKR